MAFVDDLGNVHVWETPRGNSAVKETVKETVQFKQPSGNIELLALSSDGRFVAGGSNDSDELHVSLWDIKRGELTRAWKWPKHGNATCRFKALEFSPDGDFIAAAVAGKGKAFLLRTVADEQVAELDHDSICALAFDRTGRQLVTAGTDQHLRFWKGDTGELLQTQEMGGGTLHNVRFSPVQDLLVTAHLPNVLRLWNAADMSLKSRTTLSGEANLEALGFSPNGNWLATGSSGQVIVIDARTGETMWRAGSHRGRVLSVGFADGGRVLVSGGNDSVGYCWDLMLPYQNAVHDFDKIWSELRDGSDVDVKSLLWRLMKIGDPAVAEVERRLQPVQTIVSVRAITKGLDPQAAAHRIRLATKLCESNPKFELDSRLKYAIDFLKQLRNPKSIDLLKQLATHHPSQAVRKEAMFALEEIE
jgi:WD40 repeat protein